MQETQKQSAYQARVSEIEARISNIPCQIDQLIESYTIMRKLRPSFARDYLDAIASAVRWLRHNEAELESLKAYPDCPF